MITREGRYRLGSRYKYAKNQIFSLLKEYIDDIYHFNDLDRELSFKTQTLIPECDPAKPNILLLFANPHPDSVRTGMFLCPEANKPQRFWWFMRDAGWFDIINIDYVAENLKTVFLAGRHKGPFNLFFDCFHDFPSRNPEDLARIFGQDCFHDTLLPMAENRLIETVTKHRIDAIVSFNTQVSALIVDPEMENPRQGSTAVRQVKSSYRSNKDDQPGIPVYQAYPDDHGLPGDRAGQQRDYLASVREDIYMDTLINQTTSLKAVMIREPAILFRIRHFYHPDLSPVELYDVTRGNWKLGRNRENARLAFSVFNNRIIEVYEIAQWFPAGTTFSTRKDPAPADRWEFIGNIARPHYRNRYRDKSVAHYFRIGARNPIRYINVVS